MRRLSAVELRDYLRDTEVAPLLLDVREPWEYDICHIQGSRPLPMAQVPDALAQWDPHQEIVVICHHGVRSLHVAMFLERNGFTRVVNLDGGIDAWARSIDSTLATY